MYLRHLFSLSLEKVMDTGLGLVLTTTGPLNLHRTRSIAVGISCICISTPGLWYARKGQPLLGLNGAQMGLCIFFSDFVVASAEPYSPAVRSVKLNFEIDADSFGNLCLTSLRLSSVYFIMLRVSIFFRELLKEMRLRPGPPIHLFLRGNAFNKRCHVREAEDGNPTISFTPSCENHRARLERRCLNTVRTKFAKFTTPLPP